MDPPAQPTPFTRLNVAVWRDLGDLIGMHGLQKLWWTGSRAIHGTMKRVLFRSLRGTLYKEATYKTMGSTPSNELPTQSMCLELQAQEVIVSPWPADPSALKLRRLSQYYLASVLVTSRSIRPSIPLNIPVKDLVDVKWLCGWHRIAQLTLVAGEFNPSILGSHAAPLRLVMDVCEAIEMMSNLPNEVSASQISTPFWHFVSCSHLASLSLSLPLPNINIPLQLNLRQSPNLTSFTLRLAPTAKKYFGSIYSTQPTVRLVLGPGLTHLTVHNDLTNFVNKIKLELEAERSQLLSLELSMMYLPDPLNEVYASLESLKLVKCYLLDCWSQIWHPKLRHLVLTDCFTISSIGTTTHRQRSLINPLRLPSSLESLEVTSQRLVHFTGPHSVDAFSDVTVTPPDGYETLQPSQGDPIGIYITEETLQGSSFPCTKLQRLRLDSGASIASLLLLPASLVALNVQQPLRADRTLRHFSLDEHRVLLRAMSSRASMLNQREPYASLSHILPNLASVKVTVGIWTYFMPLDSPIGSSETVPQEAGERRHIDITRWLLRSIGDLLYVRDDSTEEGVGTRVHSRRLAGQWRIWKVANKWTASLSLPPGVTEFCANFGKSSPTTLQFALKLAESKGHRAIWDSVAYSFYAEILKSWRDDPFEWCSLPEHLEHIELRGLTQELCAHCDFRRFPSLRYLLLAAQDDFQFCLAAEQIFVPTLIELVLLFEFKDDTIFAMRHANSPALRRLVISYSGTDSFYRSVRAACPAIESVEIVPFRAANAHFQSCPPETIAAGRNYMEIMALMQAEARSDVDTYEPSPRICALAESTVYDTQRSDRSFVLGLPNLSEEHRWNADTRVSFSGLGWNDVSSTAPSNARQASVPKTITLDTIGDFLTKQSLPFCVFNRFSINSNLRNWSLEPGTTTLDLSINAAECLEGWNEAEIPLKYNYFESPHANIKDHVFSVTIDGIGFPHTLTHLTLTAIHRGIDQLFSCLPASLRKLHIFNQQKCMAKSMVGQVCPHLIEDIYAPCIVLFLDGKKQVYSQIPKSLTRLVCSSLSPHTGNVPSHLKVLVINGKVLKSSSVQAPTSMFSLLHKLNPLGSRN